jgi:hypothetical protein
MWLTRRTVVPVPARSAFAGFRVPPEVIVRAVRWYLRFGLSCRDVEELLAERGIESTTSPCTGGCSGSRRCWPTGLGRPASLARTGSGIPLARSILVRRGDPLQSDAPFHYARHMTIVREVSDAMDLVARTIENGRQIVAALHDARAYLGNRYPKANEDLAGLLTEMRKTLLGLARVSDVVTDFRFTISGPARDLEPARFNNPVIDRKSRLVEFDQSISALKGSSGRMRSYAEALTKGSGRSFWELFDITGLSAQRAADVGAKFNDLYVVDERIVDLFQTLLKAAKTALRDVADALGPPGSAARANVSAAARVHPASPHHPCSHPLPRSCTPHPRRRDHENLSG